MLLRAGKSIKEIAKFADLDRGAITRVARSLDLEPATEAERRAKALYGSGDGLTFQEIARTLAGEGFSAEDGAPMHHLTVASWVKNHGWAWGGASDGEYAPERATKTPPRSRYVLRLSKALDAELNADAKIAEAAELAWDELRSDRTRVVQAAVIRAAARVDVTDLVSVKKSLMARYGETIRAATTDDEPRQTLL